METLPEPVSPPESPTPATPERRAWIVAAIVLLALLLVSGTQWWDTRDRMDDLQAELARRLTEMDGKAQELRGVARADHELLQEMQGRVGILETRLAESQSQAVALEAMYQDILRSRDERLLAEVEQSLTIAAQQLQLAGNVETALIALQGADARLAGAAQPRFVPLRRLIARDVDRLKTLPAADITGITLKIESVTAVVDSLPLAFERRPSAAAGGKKAAGAPAKATKAADAIPDWRELGDEVWRELRQLIRVERIDRGDPALLAPSQTYFLRENLKLRLLGARLALLQRDGKTYREELRQARLTMEKYFDVGAKPVQLALATLSRVAEADPALDLPGLGATLAAVRNLKQTRPAGN